MCKIVQDHGREREIELSNTEQISNSIRAISAFGELINVDPDGNCGYNAIKELLIEQNILSKPVKISEIRKKGYMTTQLITEQ